MGWFERAGAWSERHTTQVDALTAAGLVVVLAPVSAVLGLTSLGPGATALLTAVLLAPLAWRRSAPVVSVVAVYVVALVCLALGFPVVAAVVAVPVALYSVTAYGPTWAHRTAIAGAVVGSFLAGVPLATADGVLSVARSMLLTGAFGSAVYLAVWALGLVRRARHETIEALRDRARRLEVERDQQTQIATAAERSRIAREMHDIVAHSLSVIIAQADGGRYATRTDPAAAGRALETVSDTGRAALADMRRLLGVLRTESAHDPRTPGQVTTAVPGRALSSGFSFRAGRPARAAEVPDDAPAASPGTRPAPGPAPVDGPATRTERLGPMPGSEDLDDLVTRTRAAGLPVSLVTVGATSDLPPGLGLTVYRIVQEALTNVLKHGGPGARATVLVRWREESIELEVQDDGRGAAATSSTPGFGLLGMRERVEVYGGTVRTGPRPGGGFAVRATIPRTLPAGRRPTASDGTARSTED
ncbi:histidine kinase/DNA gyrase B/HSP90-like ATPase [Sediminihabitans luteus]|uniref:histidine kinase n=1 Tax=Sediminihabitans luteus TaxID=1138585 RepID=A0A2M9CDL7_9CELL|nr:histidine kinase [Sediminihabitans luteus]PJJ69968.1 histidine kinase/DNA gyrase B/HSP90-like ATPase [Sediminihabitans luteus]GII99288.1 two-component sensor histidine kinase [Sediminihabitans luteus]